MNNTLLFRGTVVTVRACGGKLLRRRVWEDLGKSVLICKESENQRAVSESQEATCSGMPREDVIEVHTEGRADD